MPRRHTPATHEHFTIWSVARAEANIAYDDWCSEPGAERYVVFRAAEDRADAAEVALERSFESLRRSCTSPALVSLEAGNAIR